MLGQNSFGKQALLSEVPDWKVCFSLKPNGVGI